MGRKTIFLLDFFFVNFGTCNHIVDAMMVGDSSSGYSIDRPFHFYEDFYQESSVIDREFDGWLREGLKSGGGGYGD